MSMKSSSVSESSGDPRGQEPDARAVDRIAVDSYRMSNHVRMIALETLCLALVIIAVAALLAANWYGSVHIDTQREFVQEHGYLGRYAFVMSLPAYSLHYVLQLLTKALLLLASAGVAFCWAGANLCICHGLVRRCSWSRPARVVFGCIHLIAGLGVCLYYFSTWTTSLSCLCALLFFEVHALYILPTHACADYFASVRRVGSDPITPSRQELMLVQLTILFLVVASASSCGSRHATSSRSAS
jgi:hypothetical protein